MPGAVSGPLRSDLVGVPLTCLGLVLGEVLGVLPLRGLGSCPRRTPRLPGDGLPLWPQGTGSRVLQPSQPALCVWEVTPSQAWGHSVPPPCSPERPHTYYEFVGVSSCQDALHLYRLLWASTMLNVLGVLLGIVTAAVLGAFKDAVSVPAGTVVLSEAGPVGALPTESL